MDEYLSSRGIDARKLFRCLNPAHEDKHPSMGYDDNAQKVHCFACDATYDVVDLVGLDYGLTAFGAKLDKACELLGVQVDRFDGQKKESVTPSTDDAGPRSTGGGGKTASFDYAAFFAEARTHIADTDYPGRRGLGPETVERFGLGYVEQWHNPKNANAPASPRLIIPTSDHGYLARDTRDDAAAAAKLKAGTVELFNAAALSNAARKPVFVVEGEIDAMSIVEVGGEAVALGGVANKTRLYDALRKLKTADDAPALPTLLLAMDNDKAGDDAAGEIADGLTRGGFSFYRVTPYGDHKDASEALTADRATFAAAVREAEGTEAREYERLSAANYIQGFIDGIAAGVDTPCIPTGFASLDDALDGGLYEGLYIVGAISSLGKTTLVCQIADHIAQAGGDALIFSLEMARSELMAKSISRHTFRLSHAPGGDRSAAKTTRGITSGKRYAHYGEADKKLIGDAIGAYAAYAERLYIIEGVGDIGVAKVREAVSKHVSMTGRTPTVVVDYLQILAPYNDRATDKQNTDKAVMELKRISRDFKTPVLAVSSFNRANYASPVTMEAFKESGAVEYSSDVLIGLQLAGVGGEGFDALTEKRKNPRQIELVVLKNRNGRVGDRIALDFLPAYNLFEDRGEAPEPPAEESSGRKGARR
jgi:replicative DNA helicase